MKAVVLGHEGVICGCQIDCSGRESFTFAIASVLSHGAVIVPCALWRPYNLRNTLHDTNWLDHQETAVWAFEFCGSCFCRGPRLVGLLTGSLTGWPAWLTRHVVGCNHQ